MEPIVKSLLLHRYRGFVSEEVDFDNPTVLVGQNGSGKSNLVDALTFLSEAMTSPLASVLAKRGGLANVKYRRHTGIYGRQLGLGVLLGNLGRGIQSARYAFVVENEKRGFTIVREQCVIEPANAQRHWFDREGKSYRSSVSDVTLEIDDESLVMPILGGDRRFTPVVRALAGIRGYAIHPGKVPESHAVNGRAGLDADGANAAAVLAEIGRRSPEDVARIGELLGAIVPGLSRVWAVPHRDRIDIEFMQEQRRSDVPRAKKTPNVQACIDRMVKRIVKQFRPEKVILFGSQARGDANADSDVDLLVVMPVSGSKREKRVAIRLAVHDIKVAKDILVSTPEEFVWRKNIVGTIEYPATREGKVLYVKR